jgi:Fe-S oxidoreductase/nitrate reductase gamma subunit
VVPTREEFLHIPPFQKALFYILTFVSLAIMGYQIYLRVKLWKQGKPIDWRPTPSYWLKNWGSYILGQRKVRGQRKRSGAPMHLLIFYGFLTLFIGTTLLAINSYSPIKFHHGLYYLIYEMTLDLMGVAFVVGVAWAFFRRWQFKPKNYSHALNDYLTLGLLFVLGVTGFTLEAARMAVVRADRLAAGLPPPDFDWSAPIGNAMSPLFAGLTPGGYQFWWWFHMVWVFIFFAVIPRMRIRHIVMALLSSAGKPQTPMGELKPIPIEEVEQTGQIGVSRPEHYSRWHLMSLDACMECGRCTDVCPANRVGKILNPKQIVLDIRRTMTTDELVPDATTHEALWECTTCNACVEACPVLIRHVDLIVDARRYLVAEGQLSGTAATMLRQTGSTGNAWGAPQSSREDWMKGLDVPLARDKQEFEYLFWVGCAGATDPGAVKTTRAFAELLNKAGVDYACLGNEERCTGDPARRTGDEFLYQEMAQQNVPVFDKYKVKKIVTACPHCMNTLRHEYPQFEGRYEVVHHTQLLQELIAAGKLKSATPEQGSVTYHDPCYLARVNNESDAPRAMLGEKTSLNERVPDAGPQIEGEIIRREHIVEPAEHARKTLCCGAGGGRMWMEEPPDKRPGNNRARQLLETGAKTVAVGCPFCRIMLDASIKQVTEEEINLVDLAELMRDAN